MNKFKEDLHRRLKELTKFPGLFVGYESIELSESTDYYECGDDNCCSEWFDIVTITFADAWGDSVHDYTYRGNINDLLETLEEYDD